MRSTLALSFLTLGITIFLGGCDRASTTSVLAKDGSLVRTVKFSHTGDGSHPASDFVEFSGTGWSVSKEKKDTDDIQIGIRTIGLGANQPDYVVKGPKEKWMTSAISYTKRSDGNYEYSETMTWVGTIKPDTDEKKAEQQKAVDTLAVQIKPLGASDAQVTAISDQLKADLSQILLGPNKPLFGDLIMQPDRASRVLRSELYLRTKLAIAKALPSATPEQVEKASRAFVTVQTATAGISVKPSAPTSPDPSNSDDGDMALIESSLQFPGHVVETNGELDDFDGTIHWTFYSPASKLKPVVLKAVVKLDQ